MPGGVILRGHWHFFRCDGFALVFVAVLGLWGRGRAIFSFFGLFCGRDIRPLRRCNFHGRHRRNQNCLVQCR